MSDFDLRVDNGTYESVSGDDADKFVVNGNRFQVTESFNDARITKYLGTVNIGTFVTYNFQNNYLYQLTGMPDYDWEISCQSPALVIAGHGNVVSSVTGLNADIIKLNKDNNRIETTSDFTGTLTVMLPVPTTPGYNTRLSFPFVNGVHYSLRYWYGLPNNGMLHLSYVSQGYGAEYVFYDSEYLWGGSSTSASVTLHNSGSIDAYLTMNSNWNPVYLELFNSEDMVTITSTTQPFTLSMFTFYSFDMTNMGTVDVAFTNSYHDPPYARVNGLSGANQNFTFAENRMSSYQKDNWFIVFNANYSIRLEIYMDTEYTGILSTTFTPNIYYNISKNPIATPKVCYAAGTAQIYFVNGQMDYVGGSQNNYVNYNVGDDFFTVTTSIGNIHMGNLNSYTYAAPSSTTYGSIAYNPPMYTVFDITNWLNYDCVMATNQNADQGYIKIDVDGSITGNMLDSSGKNMLQPSHYVPNIVYYGGSGSRQILMSKILTLSKETIANGLYYHVSNWGGTFRIGDLDGHVRSLNTNYSTVAQNAIIYFENNQYSSITQNANYIRWKILSPTLLQNMHLSSATTTTPFVMSTEKQSPDDTYYKNHKYYVHQDDAPISQILKAMNDEQI